jgi:hypothetical protein
MLAREELERRAKALPSLEPFVRTLAAALEGSAVYYCRGWSGEVYDAQGLARRMLPFRARLMPDHAAESADLLLRLAIRWQARDFPEAFDRAHLLRDALRVVRELLARDPAQARPHLDAWRVWLADEDPLAVFRSHCAHCVDSVVDTVEEVRCGEDPYAGARESMRKIAEKVDGIVQDEKVDHLRRTIPSPWIFRWYARPFFYWSTLRETDSWGAALDGARTEASLRDLLRRPEELDRVTGSFAKRTVEQIALLRIARIALAVAAGDAPPQFENPFTGRPIVVYATDAATEITATRPEGFDTVDELLTWEVPRSR